MFLLQNPWFLWALPLAALPLLLVLWRRRRPTPVLLPTLRFLRQAQQALAKRRRLQLNLLLLCRILLLITLTLLFASPLFAPPQDQATLRPKVIILDQSYTLRSQAGQAWRETLAQARSFLQSLPPQQTCLILAEDLHSPVAPAASLVHLLTEETLRPIAATSRLDRLCDTARKLLPGCHIHVFSDGAAAPWADSLPESAKPPQDLSFHLISSKPGAAILRAQLLPPQHTAAEHPDNRSHRIRVSFADPDAQLAQRQLILTLGQEPPERRSLAALGPGAFPSLNLEIPAGQEARSLTLTLSGSDSLADDDSFHIILRPARIQSSAAGLLKANDPSFAVLRALLSLRPSQDLPASLTPCRDGDAQDAPLIFVGRRLADGQAEALMQALNGGAHLIILPAAWPQFAPLVQGASPTLLPPGPIHPQADWSAALALNGALAKDFRSTSASWGLALLPPPAGAQALLTSTSGAAAAWIQPSPAGGSISFWGLDLDPDGAFVRSGAAPLILHELLLALTRIQPQSEAVCLQPIRLARVQAPGAEPAPRLFLQRPSPLSLLTLPLEAGEDELFFTPEHPGLYAAAPGSTPFNPSLFAVNIERSKENYRSLPPALLQSCAPAPVSTPYSPWILLRCLAVLLLALLAAEITLSRRLIA